MDNKDILVRLGAAEYEIERLKAMLLNPIWSNWSPTLTQSGSVTFTTAYARYVTLGRLVMIECRLQITGTGTAGNAIIVGGIPAAIAPAQTGNQADARGSWTFLDSGNTWYVGSLYPGPSNNLGFMSYGNGNLLGITPNFALANNDRLGFHAVWER